eukprot:gene17633-biopygen5354
MGDNVIVSVIGHAENPGWGGPPPPPAPWMQGCPPLGVGSGSGSKVVSLVVCHSVSFPPRSIKCPKPLALPSRTPATLRPSPPACAAHIPTCGVSPDVGGTHFTNCGRGASLATRPKVVVCFPPLPCPAPRERPGRTLSTVVPSKPPLPRPTLKKTMAWWPARAMPLQAAVGHCRPLQTAAGPLQDLDSCRPCGTVYVDAPCHFGRGAPGRIGREHIGNSPIFCNGLQRPCNTLQRPAMALQRPAMALQQSAMTCNRPAAACNGPAAACNDLQWKNAAAGPLQAIAGCCRPIAGCCSKGG